MPVYKTEMFVEKAILSIKNQSFKDWELIIVDDGSPDNSGIICDNYAKQDNRIIVIHQENGGSAMARQTAINNASGDYIIHLDSDDWCESDMLLDLYSEAIRNNFDVVFCDYIIDYGRYKKYVKAGPFPEDNISILKKLIIDSNGFTWNKLVKRDCYYHPREITWLKGQNIFEDLLFTIQLMKYPRIISYVSKAYYHYVQNLNPNSYIRHTSMQPQFARLNNILPNYVDTSIYETELLLLKKKEAYEALVDRDFPTDRFLHNYTNVRLPHINWYGEKDLNYALKGHVRIVRVKILLSRYIRSLLKTLSGI